MKNAPHYLIREPRDVHELESLLRLRYREFLPIGMIAENPCALDLDCFDLNACHLGLFRDAEGVQTAIGTIRIVVQQPTPQASMVREIASDQPFFSQKLLEKPAGPLPLFTYAPFPEALDAFRDAARKKSAGLLEGSRFCIRKEDTTLALAAFLMEMSIAVSMARFPDYTWCAASRTRHEGWYGGYGFRRIAGTTRFEHSVGSVCVMHSSADRLAPAGRTRMENMKAAFEQYGRVGLDIPEQSEATLEKRTMTN